MTLKAVRGLLEAIAERIIHFGPAGTGTAYKLIVNMLGAVQIASAAEAMAIAERAGLDRALVAEPSRRARRQALKSYEIAAAWLPTTTIETSCSLRSCD